MDDRLTINRKATAPIFNIQSYCIHDGPGIRSTVFVKGCPLRCLWCANPESQAARPELMTYIGKCTGCGACVEACQNQAIHMEQDGEKAIALTDRAKCTGCGNCVDACHYGAREICGKMMDVQSVLETVKRDKLFFDGSGGGMTISGGEMLAHPEFCENLLAAARQEGIHTAVESCAYASRDIVRRVFKHVDLALLDIKHMDSDTHKHMTGVPNEVILENIRYIAKELGLPFILRLPVIPGYNDSTENIAALGAFAASLGDDIHVELLPYHRLGEGKRETLGRSDFINVTPPDSAHMESLKQLLEGFGISVKIGG